MTAQEAREKAINTHPIYNEIYEAVTNSNFKLKFYGTLPEIIQKDLITKGYTLEFVSRKEYEEKSHFEISW